jgi:hypothetical protein
MPTGRRLGIAAGVVLLGAIVWVLVGTSVAGCLGPIGVTAIQCARATGVYPSVGLGLPALALTILIAVSVVAPGMLRPVGRAALAEALGARLLGTGRVTGVEASIEDPYVSAIQLDDDGGVLLRLVARSELLAVVRDGVTTAASPEIIVALDSVSGDVLQVDEITLARNVIVLALEAPAWWTSSPDRERHITPAGFGLRGLGVPA